MNNPSPVIYAGAVVTAPDGRILCQLRDDKPGIRFPGYWSASPGGHVEAGEAPRDAIVRELLEEFEARVSDLAELMVLTETEKEIRGVYHVFEAKLAVPTSDIKCHEGQKADFFLPEVALTLQLHPVSRKILQAYLRRKRRR